MKGSRHIAIVGGSGSGKTRLAGRLCSALEQQAVSLSLDDFYRDLSHLEPSDRDLVNFDDPAAMDWEAARTVMDQLAGGRVAHVPTYDFATHTRRKEPRLVIPKPLVIWDGLWLLHHSWIRERFILSVFIDCSGGERLARRARRDVEQRGRTVESVCQQFEHHVAPMHERFVEPQRELATHCVASPITDGVWIDLLDRVRALSGEAAPAMVKSV
jgi:uridine kinase